MVASAAALTVGLTAACGGGSDKKTNNGGSSSSGTFNAAATQIVSASDKKGGTLHLWSSQAPDSLDPAISYYAWTINFNRFYSRTLMTYSPKPGKDGLT